MPAHTNESHATELTMRYERMYLSGTREEKAAVEREIVSLRTPKWKLYTAGLAICLTAAVIFIAIYRFKLWDARAFRTLETPRTRSGLLFLAGAAWFALLPAFLWTLDDEYAQDDLMPTMDNGHGMAFVAGPPFIAITLTMLMVIGRYIVLRNARLPANLWIWDRERPYRNLVWTIFYGVIAAAITALIVGALSGSPCFLPSLMVGLYVVLSSRAAILSGGHPR